MCDGIVVTGVHFKLIRSSFMSSIYWSFSSKTWPNTRLILLWWKRPMLSLACVFQSRHTYLILNRTEKENRKQFRAHFYGYTWPHPLWSHSVGPNSSSHMLLLLVLGIRPEVAWGFSVFLSAFCFRRSCACAETGRLCMSALQQHNIYPGAPSSERGPMYLGYGDR